MDRRKFIAGAGGAIVTAQTGQVFGQDAPGGISYECRESVRQTPGPYLKPGSQLRSDIREDRQGVPLRLDIQVTSNSTCQPASGCIVDIWHSDANGLYSAVDNIVFDPDTLRPTDDAIDRKDKTFLRGHQETNDRGIASFTTIYPGWYFPRLTHIHARIIVPGQEWATMDTQIYLPSDIEKEVFSREPYAGRGANPIDIYKDGVVKGDTVAVKSLTASLQPDSNGFVGRIELVADGM